MNRSTFERYFFAASVLALPILALGQMSPGAAPSIGTGFFPNPVKGKQLYVEKCAECHGADLRGTGKGPPQLHSIYVPGHHGDEAYQLAVRDGVRQHHRKFGDMRPVPGLSPEDVGHVTAFIRAEQRKSGIQ